jgi:anti-sigma regulatory factor (Ser/Thr protein kinase)
MKETRTFNSLDELPTLLDLTAETARRAGLPESMAFKAQVLLEELFVNIFMHAYQGHSGPVLATLEAGDGGLRLRLEDSGPPFNPLLAEKTDLQKRFAEGKPGGAGLALLRSLAEESAYAREKERNVISFRLGK